MRLLAGVTVVLMAALPSSGVGAATPSGFTTKQATLGRGVYTQYCAACHGGSLGLLPRLRNRRYIGTLRCAAGLD